MNASRIVEVLILLAVLLVPQFAHAQLPEPLYVDVIDHPDKGRMFLVQSGKMGYRDIEKAASVAANLMNTTNHYYNGLILRIHVQSTDSEIQHYSSVISSSGKYDIKVWIKGNDGGFTELPAAKFRVTREEETK